MSGKYVRVDDVMELINTSNRGTCDYFIVDQKKYTIWTKLWKSWRSWRTKQMTKFWKLVNYSYTTMGMRMPCERRLKL